MARGSRRFLEVIGNYIVPFSASGRYLLSAVFSRGPLRDGTSGSILKSDLNFVDNNAWLTSTLLQDIAFITEQFQTTLTSSSITITMFSTYGAIKILRSLFKDLYVYQFMVGTEECWMLLKQIHNQFGLL